MTLKEGDKAPDFRAIDQDGREHTLELYRGNRLVLYFYPADMTSGCTAQACDFRDNFDAFIDKNTAILGVSPDDRESHKKFEREHKLSFPLLVDTDKTIATDYGVWQEKKMMGKTYMGIVRSTFVIGPDSTIEQIYSNVRVDGHVARVLDAIPE
jgi:peroxiredoxin Q/BCP